MTHSFPTRRSSDLTSGAGTYPEFERVTAGVGVGSRPGVKASSFIVEVAEDELAELTARERAAGQPDFAPKLSGDGPLHAVVAHRWPADEGVTGFEIGRASCRARVCQSV